MTRVLIADKMSNRAETILTEAGIEVDVKTGRSEDEIVADCSQYDGIIVRSATKITPKVLNAAKSLKVVGRAGVGVDNIDLGAATAAGVLVMNTPLGNIRSAAEHSIAMLLAMARRIPQADGDMKRGEWTKKKHSGVEVGDKTLGVIGMGKVGMIVTKAFQGMGMHVLASDPMLTGRRAKELGVELAELGALLERSDFVTIHAPLNEHTRGMIGAEELAKMKPTARLVNCARGGIVDEAALADALRDGVIAGAACDVFSEEPLKENPFEGLDNIVLTPHLGASTAEAQVKVAEDVARQFVGYLVDGEIRNAVNLSVTIDPELRGYAALAEVMGSFLGQVIAAPPKRLRLGAYGRIAGRDVSVLTISALKGLLAQSIEGTVNLVNAGDIAAQHGIDLATERNAECRNYNNLMLLSIETREGERSISGTLFEDRSPRILAFDGVEIDLKPAPRLLVMIYPDRPGVIGKLGTALGDAGLNIADMSLARRKKAGKAFVVLTVDDPLPDGMLEEIGKLVDGLDEIHLVSLEVKTEG